MLNRASYLLLFLTLAAPPALARAQQEGGREAHASVVAAVGATRVQGEATTTMGGAALLSLGGPLAIGGGGWVMTGKTNVEGQTPGARYDFRMAYGGLAAQARIAGDDDHGVEIRALVGAGNGKIRIPVVGTLIAADNFGVVEPEVVGTIRLFPAVRVEASFAWRWAFGVEDLPGVSPDDVGGYSARIGFAVGGF